MQSCAVIGCGSAGMAAATALRQCGLLVTCFELAADPGGVWNSDTRKPFSSRGLVSPIHPTMRCILPKDLFSFSDVRFDFTVPQFPHHSSVRRYLEQYAEKKGVRGLVRFNTKVQSVRYDCKGAVWRVITVNVVNGDVFEWSFDKVCVCTGQTHEPRYPSGIKDVLKPYVSAGGELHHASHVKDFRQFKNKRVVVVGNGVTAWDYCMELRRSGADVYHSSYHPPGQEQGELWDGVLQCGSSINFNRNGAMRDAGSAALQLLSCLPGWRKDHTKGSRIVSRWMQFSNAELFGKIPSVGHVILCEGRGILFAEERKQTMEIVDEAKVRAMVRRKQDIKTLESRNTVADNNNNNEPSGIFIDNVDAVICATGYHLRFPFLHRDLRNVLEDPPLLLQERGNDNPQKENQQNETYSHGVGTTRSLERRGLYLGTLYAQDPSIAFVGIQRELLPPFMLFEAQSKFVAYAFTGRLKLPYGAVNMLAHEADLMQRYPPLVHLYSPEGLGLYSAVYFNVLQEELQVGSRSTYTAGIMERQKWVLLTSLLRLVHKIRSLAPLKRKKQHILFSNNI
ncbi:dimethylaniline monooxygenase (N-oxide forming) [Trypanosoma theileri]|uniref:Dimethylaniline monooxygenase (N-oxide forming) n=1 Tax=Trypanosoma theileri TaxID=67003 RepID=A0A1X0NTN1_9TRYP|nr:dimethylaniline monooxygenase (N-oxide forming) [Trypanosoma theileri]ORC88055.1 dimethylaniline monooxygenase (N-oxide forming) [Trypanosoma theileri]